MDLPERGREAEDQFLRGLTAGEGAEDDLLADLVDAAMAARRVQLAARLVGLISCEGEQSEAIEKARAASRLLLLHGRDAPSRSYDALEEAWMEVRRRRVTAMKRRQRERSHGVGFVLDVTGQRGRGRRRRR